MTEDKKRGTDSHSNDDPSDKQPNPTKPTDETNSKNTPSLASRIQSSASGLARQAFSASGSSGDAAQFLTTGSKAGTTTTTSSSALAAAEQYNQVSGPSAPSSAGAQLHGNNAATFRSTTTPQQGGFEIPRLTEEEFAQAGNDFLEPSASTSTIDKGKGKAREQLSSITHHHHAPGPADGSAVVSLLSDSTFDPTFSHEPAEIIETELSPPQQLTPAEIQMLESFRRQMIPQPDTSFPSTHRLTSASLVPDIDTILDSAPAQTDADAAALRDTVLANLPGSEDWVDVEERYHDEVWGWLKPTLEAAAKELEEKKEDPKGEDGPAVQRLKMVLTHMRAKL
ncbi:hypothetical protein BDV26DRAFT_288692 [Aspergillus bertholletiae]|uniref:Uncharacterized protein n=1 Tax=Aspergillus bertholletiae TaxID=1226010 RepID=A0A5N7BK36_9EURO|nr:hypothetical protein BDV26DRAFT_288692 [Aspergillus bertholletiae]